MAARFWKGSGTWNASNTANWSATSGGATGVSVPTSADTVTFDGSSGVCTIPVGYSAVCSTLTLSSLFNGNSIISDTTGTQSTITVSGTSIAITPGNILLRDIVIIAQSASAATSINVSLASLTSCTNSALWIGQGISSTATFTLTTNAAFYKSASAYLDVSLYSGTLAGGAVTMSAYNITVFGGTYAPTGTVTVNNNLLVTPTSSATATLGTSVINAASGIIQLGNADGSGTTTITVGATQTLNAFVLNLYPTVAGTVTFRTITVTSTGVITISPASGVNVSVANAITCNGVLNIATVGTIVTLPTVTLISVTGSATGDCGVSVVDAGFTCGAISLTSAGGNYAYYSETSQGAVSVT